MNRWLVNRGAVPTGAQVRVVVGVWRVQLVEAEHRRGGVGGGTGRHPTVVHDWPHVSVFEGVVPGRGRKRVNGGVVVRENDRLKEFNQFTAH